MRLWLFVITLSVFCAPVVWSIEPGADGDAMLLPNGWRITPAGQQIPTEDLIWNMVATPDGAAVVALHGGFHAHGLLVIDTATREATQRIPLDTAGSGLVWASDGKQLYLSGGNASRREDKHALIYVFDYAEGKLSKKPVRTLMDEATAPDATWWAGLALHPVEPRLFAANRTAGHIAVFDTATGEVVARIPAEVNPFDLVLADDGATLYCSNWASDSITVIDTATLSVAGVVGVGDGPSDMVLGKDGRLYVACANENRVYVVDTELRRTTETIVTAFHEEAPEGSTPNALALSPDEQTLYVANGDNYNVCVIDIEEPGDSEVEGFIPAGWYPTALTVTPDGKALYVGNSKGLSPAANVNGPHSPLGPGPEGTETTKSLVHGSVGIVGLPISDAVLSEHTRQVFANCPYHEGLLTEAPPAPEDTIVPSTVGVGSPIKHVIYILRENRTYDQVLGDMPQGNGDPRITIFGREVTPNAHALAEQFVLLDNTFCDGEVSVDGHMWSNAAYATDFVEKNWPAAYGGKSETPETMAAIPASGFLWDQCLEKGLTYRSYGEFAERVSEGMSNQEFAFGLVGHVAPQYLGWGARDTENAKEFIREFDEFEKNYDDPDPNKRLPNFIIMSLPEDHTKGTRPGEPTPRAAVASNDYALGMIVDRVSHSRYWPETAIFVIEDDAQDGSDHVDARRTVALAISPYARHGIVDSGFYTTSSLLRTVELLLGLRPMSQFDAAALPMYASFSKTADPTPYTHVPPSIDIDEVNEATAWGAQESLDMDLSHFDRAPMFALNEIVWKSVRGCDSKMPLPVHRFHAAQVTE